MKITRKITIILVAIMLITFSALVMPKKAYASSIPLQTAKTVNCNKVYNINALNKILIADSDLQNIINAGNSWLEAGETKSGKDSDEFVNEFAQDLLGIGQILVAIGVVTLLIVTAIMAIKWITATPDKKAKLQTQLIGLVVSAIVIFGAVGIWNLVRGIMGKVEAELATNTTSVVMQIDNN